MALTDSIIHYWKFDSSNSNDSIGSANGTDTSISYSSSYGKINQGASLNGSSSYISLPTGVLNASNSFTISLWFYKIATPSTQYGAVIFEKYNGGTGWNYGTPNIGIDNSGNISSSNRDGSGVVSSGTFISNASNNTWYHLVLIYDTSVGTYGTTYGYLNGSLVFTSTNSRNFINYSSNIKIGKSDDAWQYAYLQGYIDEVGIWSRALSSTEVTELYNSGTGKQYPFVSFLPKSTRRLVGAVNRASFY